jgi:hypothetical protein
VVNYNKINMWDQLMPEEGVCVCGCLLAPKIGYLLYVFMFSVDNSCEFFTFIRFFKHPLSYLWFE